MQRLQQQPPPRPAGAAQVDLSEPSIPEPKPPADKEAKGSGWRGKVAAAAKKQPISFTMPVKK
eukprot:3859693-Rhodomonas_salina.1